MTLDTFAAGKKTDGELKKLSDRYNSISGSFGSFLTRPVELFVGLLMSAAYLCFVTDFTLTHGSIGHWQYVSVLTAAALAYLFSNGLNALNVQIVPGSVSPRIAAEDLAFVKGFVDNQSMLANGSLATTWDRAYAENTRGNSVLNTILRSKLLPFETAKSQCTKPSTEGVIFPISAIPLVAFSFQTQTWQVETLTHALEPVGSLKIAMNAKNPSELHESDARLPMPVSVANNLALIGVEVLRTALYNLYSSFTVGVGLTTAIYRASLILPPGPLRVADYYKLPASDSSTSNFVTTYQAF